MSWAQVGVVAAQARVGEGDTQISNLGVLGVFTVVEIVPRRMMSTCGSSSLDRLSVLKLSTLSMSPAERKNLPIWTKGLLR